MRILKIIFIIIIAMVMLLAGVLLTVKLDYGMRVGLQVILKES